MTTADLAVTVERGAWRPFEATEALTIEMLADSGHQLRCPSCHTPLLIRVRTRFDDLQRLRPRGSIGYDLECSQCRRFHPRRGRVRPSLHLLRLRCFLSAVLLA